MFVAVQHKRGTDLYDPVLFWVSPGGKARNERLDVYCREDVVLTRQSGVTEVHVKDGKEPVRSYARGYWEAIWKALYVDDVPKQFLPAFVINPELSGNRDISITMNERPKDGK